MNECLNNEPNYITYYNSIQMCLPLGLGYEITPTDELLGSLTVVSIFSLTKSLKTLIISMLLSFFYCQIREIISSNM